MDQFDDPGGPREAPSEPVTSESRTSVKVLIVDDDAASRKGLAALLSGWGYATEEATDGEEALQKARTVLPSVVITRICVGPERDSMRSSSPATKTFR